MQPVILQPDSKSEWDTNTDSNQATEIFTMNSEYISNAFLEIIIAFMFVFLFANHK